jgi:hypothetical protein
MENKIYIECKCDHEMIQLTRDYDQIFMSFYRYGHNSNYSWRWRFKYIWQIIKNGHPYSDCVILNKQEQDKLINFLTRGK